MFFFANGRKIPSACCLPTCLFVNGGWLVGWLLGFAPNSICISSGVNPLSACLLLELFKPMPSAEEDEADEQQKSSVGNHSLPSIVGNDNKKTIN
jgi:hypothetical protein